MYEVCETPGCGGEVIQPEIGRRRRKCYKCNPKDTRDRTSRYHSQQATVTELPVLAPGEPGSLVHASRVALEKAGVADGWEAAAALALAQIIDSGKHGASGPGGTVKAHRDAMQFCLQSAPEDVDNVVSWIFGGS